MPKQKKTREQKILADKRRETLGLSLYSLPIESVTKQTNQYTVEAGKNISITTVSYGYLMKDLRKTTIFMGIIISIELLLKFFVK